MLTINYPDKILAGVHQSYTVLSDEGVPEGQVRLGGAELDSRILPLGPPKDEPSGTTKWKYKITFFIPEDAAGKTLEMKLAAGGARVEEEKEIIAS